jgi:tetratricopeptide (TPR) repeat protein
LTDEDGPYIELMAGVYTDNQPDFSFLQPFETRTFSQFWYPIREIGPAKNANRRMAVNFEAKDQQIRIGVCATEAFENARIVVTAGPDPVIDMTVDVGPGRPVVLNSSLEREYPEPTLRVFSASGEELIRYQREEQAKEPLPRPATEPLPPNEIPTCEELYLTGLHLEQYRHATRYPELYWNEALRRDPDDVRCNNAMGLLRLRRGEFAQAEVHFRRAIERLTRRNPNPADGELHYNLGLSLRFLNHLDEAYEAFYKATWIRAWQAPGYYALAQIDGMRGDFASALEHLDRALTADSQLLQARNLKSAVLRALGRVQEAAVLAAETIRMDRLDFWSRNELNLATAAPDREFFELMRRDAQTCLDIALDYAGAGLWRDAITLIRRFRAFKGNVAPIHPMLHYALGFFLEKAGDPASALESYRDAVMAQSDYCFPARLEEMVILEAARQANPHDARAPYYLANLLYDKRRYHEAIQYWKQSCMLDPGFAIPWRNLGIAEYNIGKDSNEARRCYQKAFGANPTDARLLYEWDQLEKRIGAPPLERFERLETHLDLVYRRDDLVVELVTLYNLTGRSEKALEVLGSRRFHPWEGGEGLVSGQYVAAHLTLGRALLESNQPAPALAHFESARNYPDNLGEGKHLLTSEADLDYFTGEYRASPRF